MGCGRVRIALAVAAGLSIGVVDSARAQYQGGSAADGPGSCSQRPSACSPANRQGSPSTNSSANYQAVGAALGAVIQALEAQRQANQAARLEAERNARIEEERQRRADEERARAEREQRQEVTVGDAAVSFSTGQVIETIGPCLELYAETVENGQLKYKALRSACGYDINVKYIFERSKPFAGRFVTLWRGKSTFPPERAEADEKVYATMCAAPLAPTQIAGDCVDDSGAR